MLNANHLILEKMDVSFIFHFCLGKHSFLNTPHVYICKQIWPLTSHSNNLEVIDHMNKLFKNNLKHFFPIK